MRFFFSCCFLSVVLAATSSSADDLTRDQQLIVACHRLDVDGVVSLLREGSDVNARFGDGDPKEFLDPWVNGWPSSANAWTPLIAVANASDYPDPPRKVETTFAEREWALEQQAKIPLDQIERRRRTGVEFARILLSHQADIDADDGYGATALYDAVAEQKLDLAKLLLRFNAKVNTKTGIYIDGPGDLTPLHEACRSAELTKLLLEKGADPNAKDTDGRTPADWARLFGVPAVVRLYESR